MVDNLQADSSQTQWILNEGHKIDSLPLDWFSAIIYFTRVIGINNLRDDVWCDADFPGSGRIIWLWIRWITFPDPLDTLWRATDMYICITGWVGCVMVGGVILWVALFLCIRYNQVPHSGAQLYVMYSCTYDSGTEWFYHLADKLAIIITENVLSTLEFLWLKTYFHWKSISI